MLHIMDGDKTLCCGDPTDRGMLPLDALDPSWKPPLTRRRRSN